LIPFAERALAMSLTSNVSFRKLNAGGSCFRSYFILASAIFLISGVCRMVSLPFFSKIGVVYDYFPCLISCFFS